MTSPSYTYGSGYSGGGSWFTPTGGYTASSHNNLSPSTAYQLSQRPSTNTQQSGSYDANAAIARYQAELQRIQALLQQMGEANAGWEREKLEAQREDAKRALENAYKIAELQAQTSRYGIDQQTRVALKQLEENQRQFDRNHELEQRKLGLTYAQTATEYLSTPDRYFQGANYLNMAGRVFANQSGSGAAVGQPVPKTEQDFANLAAGGTGQQAYTGTSPADVAQRAAGAGGAGADERVKALTGVIKALPPSQGAGLDNNDQAVMAAARALYSTNLNPGQYQRIASSPTNRGITRSAISRLGDSPDEWEARQRRNQIGFGSSRAA